MLNQTVKSLAWVVTLMIGISSQVGFAQGVEQVRWKSEAQVRAMFGEPNSIQGPVGTHASYTLWKYDDVTIAFANNRAFHLFDKNSLSKEIELGENRLQ